MSKTTVSQADQTKIIPFVRFHWIFTPLDHLQGLIV